MAVRCLIDVKAGVKWVRANNYSGSRVNIVMIMHVAVIILSMAMLLIGLSQQDNMHQCAILVGYP
jgi:hypothetical protein